MEDFRMFKPARRFLAAFLPVLGLALVPAANAADPIDLPAPIDLPEPKWVLSPTAAPAEQSFSLSAQSYRYNCGTVYGNQSVSVMGDRIDLSFTAEDRLDVACPMIYRPYGPTFRMPALKPGKYQVFMNLLLPCHVTQPACKAAIQVEEAGALSIGVEETMRYTITPTATEAGKDFSLQLIGSQFGCAHEYSMMASRVQDGRITLTFLDKINPVVLCMAVDGRSYGPTYKIPGLRAGTYEVFAERLPACVEQGCEVGAVAVPAGKLSVTSEPVKPRGWFLKEKRTLAGEPFALQLLNHDYGNCHTRFTHTSVVAQGGRIDVSFVIETDTTIQCVTDIRPHGPSFRMDALKTGTYPVYVSVLPKCLYTEPRCAIIAADEAAGLPVIDPIRPFPVPVDTLQVIRTLAVGGQRSGAAAPQAGYRDGSLSLRLPAGSQGTWQAEVLTLSGRRLQGGEVAVSALGEATISFARKPERGVYLLRLASPARETHTLRVPVNP
jgi:hypothetical protein